MKKLLFPICDRDYSTIMGRISWMLSDLSKNFIVELMTISKEVYDDIHKKLGAIPPNLHIKLIEGKLQPVTYDLRNDFSKIFVRYTYDMVLPGTDLKLWKTAAFDDFWGHISSYAFEGATNLDADMVLFPVINYDETTPDDADVFYTTLLFNAKEAGIKVVGYQVYPVSESNQLMPRLLDAIIVKKEYEKDFYVERGNAPEKIRVLENDMDIYSLSTIEDAYKNNMYNSEIQISRAELGIVVYNHPKYRPQLREVFRIIAAAKLPVVLSLVKRGFVIRELMEDKIIEGVFFEDIKKIKCRFFLVETASLVPVVMISDVIISPTYIGPVQFAAQNGKEAWVYNPRNGQMPDVDGVTFINSPGDLAHSLKAAYERKQETEGMADIIKALLRK